MMFDVLCERLEAGFLEQLTKRALAIPTRGEMMAIVFAQVLDFGGGMLVVDLPALLAGAAVQSRIFGGGYSYQLLYVDFGRGVGPRPEECRPFYSRTSVPEMNRAWVPTQPLDQAADRMAASISWRRSSLIRLASIQNGALHSTSSNSEPAS